MSSEITVIGVYESAAAIGRDLEKLIDAVGSDLVAEVMPKVIQVLEQLEACVKQRENENSELQKMQEELRKAKQEGTIASEENLRLIMDVKQLDSQRQKEIRDWMAMATELERDNKWLKTQLSEKEGIVDREKAHEKEALQVLYQLKETVDAQRDQVRAKDGELRTRALEVDALQQHVSRLANVTANLRRKNELLNAMAKNFIQEKSELQSKLSAIGKETASEHHAIESRDVIDVGRQQSSEGGASGNISLAANDPIDMKGKMIIDLADSNRPRFTLHELQTVLAERDELKLDIMELEDELEQYRPKQDEEHLTEADRQQRRGFNQNKNKGEPSGIKKLFSFLFRGKNQLKSASTTLDENTWEFLDKPAQRAELTVPMEDQRARATSGPVPTSIEILEESPTTEGQQRSRSYTGPSVKVSEKKPFKHRERTTFVRTESNQMVEVGQDIISSGSINEERIRTTVSIELSPAPIAVVNPTCLPISRNNCNSSNSLENNAQEAFRTAVGEATGQGSNDVSKVMIDSNGNEQTESGNVN